MAAAPMASPAHRLRTLVTGLFMSARIGRALALALALLVLAWLEWSPPSGFALWNERLSSLTWSLADAQQQEKRVVVVDIDEKSVQALGPWPWPRERIAQLLIRLDQQEVGLKVVDILFDGSQAQDPQLRQALASGAPTVMAQLFALQAEPPVRTGSLSGALEGLSTPGSSPGAMGGMSALCPAPSARALGYMAPAASLLGAAKVGHITPVVDADGAVRRVPALVCYEGKLYPSLALAALSAATGESPRWQAQGLASPTQAFATIRVGDFVLPVNRQGELRVSYQMPRQGFFSLSAADVLTGQAPPELLKGAWVIIGSTAMGAGDAVVTPQGGAVGGVEVHAQLLAAALDNRTPYQPQGAAAWPWLAALVAAAVMLAALALGRFSAGPVLAVSALAALGLVSGLHAYALLQLHWVLHWGGVAVFVGVAAAGLLLAEVVRVRIERERLYDNLSSYLPEEAARKIGLSVPSEDVQAERRSATVMFIDLRNFSAYCEAHPAQDSALVLHRFYTQVEREVAAHGGAVEQMVGDGIMAVWNGSRPCVDHARQALAAAVPIWRAVLADLPREGSRKAPPLDVGIGLESGEVMVGAFGPSHRKVHTVMGDTVTVATRLEALTAELAYPILVGPQTVAQSRPDKDARIPSAATASKATLPPPVKVLGDFLLSGLHQPRKIHAVVVEFDHSHLQLVYSMDQVQAG